MATGFINLGRGGVKGLTVTASDVLAGKTFTRDGMSVEVGTYVPTLKTAIIDVSADSGNLYHNSERSIAYLPKGNIVSIESIDNRPIFDANSYYVTDKYTNYDTGGIVQRTIGSIDIYLKLKNDNFDIALSYLYFTGNTTTPYGIYKRWMSGSLYNINLLNRTIVGDYRVRWYKYDSSSIYDENASNNYTSSIGGVSDDDMKKLASSPCRLYIKMERWVTDNPSYTSYVNEFINSIHYSIRKCKIKVTYI